MFRSSSSGAGLLHLAIGGVAAAAAMIWPLTLALAPTDVSAARIVCALLALSASVAVAFLGGRGRPVVWMTAGASAAALALLLLWQYIGASSACVGDYNGQPVIIGRELTPLGQAYMRENQESLPEVLLAVGGQTDQVWTANSIARCRFSVSWGGLLTFPLIAVCLSSLASGRRRMWAGSAKSRPVTPDRVPAGSTRYDAFISYRRLDRERAELLLEELESRGFRVAIDFRDFRPNEQVIIEMERCIRESRFLLCVITEHYASSGFTTEEASVARLLDLIERRNRVVPLIFDKVPMPAWLQGLVGIDFGEEAQAEPIERLVTLLSSKSQGSTT